jgi:hypothetical protein
MNPGLAVIAVVCIVVGIPAAIWPYRTARFAERWNAIGSKRRWSAVEPADWRVTVERIVGTLLTGFGVAYLVVG